MGTNGEARWVVEELSGGTASIAVEGGGLRYVARRLLPPAAGAGTVVRVTVDDASAGTRTVHLRLDPAAAGELTEEVRRTLGRLRA
jgi:hypothetical protein